MAQRVAEGAYHSTAAAVSAALIMLEKREKAKQLIAVGIEQADREEFEEFTAESVIATAKKV